MPESLYGLPAFALEQLVEGRVLSLQATSRPHWQRTAGGRRHRALGRGDATACRRCERKGRKRKTRAQQPRALPSARLSPSSKAWDRSRLPFRPKSKGAFVGDLVPLELLPGAGLELGLLSAPDCSIPLSTASRSAECRGLRLGPWGSCRGAWLPTEAWRSRNTRRSAAVAP